MNVLDLFSGIGGFSLGLERAGFRTVAFCEIDPFCRAVLKKHWPDVPCYDDVTTLTADRLAADGFTFPAMGNPHGKSQHSSIDGRSKEGSGETSPTRPIHLSDSNCIDAICGDFPCQDISVAGKGEGIEGSRSGLWKEYARITGELRPRYVIVENVAALLARGLERVLGDLAALGYDAEWHCIPASAVGAPHRRDRVWIVAWPKRSATANGSGALREPSRSDWWLTEPDVGRVAHGVPARVDRLRSLGNAVVPQIAEIIGRAIMSVRE